MDDFVSDESQSEDEFFTTVVQQRNFCEKLQNECGHYDHVIKELKKEILDRDTTLKKLQEEIEHYQMDILYNDLKIEKAQNVYEELRDASDDQPHLDPQEKIEAISRLENEVAKGLRKYINRVYYSKRLDFEEKDKVQFQYSAVCVKFYKEDPTNEDYGTYNAQNYSYKVFGLSNDLTFRKLFDLAKEQWNIDKNSKEYVLTDPDHHDLELLMDVPVAQFLTHETHGYAMFIMRKNNTTMKELVTSQKAGISLVQETEKQGRITEEYKKIFDTLRKAKPGIYTYENQDDQELPVHNSEGSIFNFIWLAGVLILFILAFVFNNIKPSDQQMMNDFSATLRVPQFFDSINEFFEYIPQLFYDLDANNRIGYLHYIPLGKRRLITKKMYRRRCLDYLEENVCSFEDKFTKDNLNTEPLQRVSSGSWMNYIKAEGKNKLNIKGKSSSFDGSGFIYDFPLNLNEGDSRNRLNDDLRMNNNGDYFDESSRAFIFHTLLFEPNRKMFIDRTILFEITAAEVIYTTEKISYFKPYSSENSDDKLLLRINIALLVGTILAYFFNLVRQIFRTKKFRVLFKIHNIIKYINTGLVIAYFILFYQKPEASIQEIVSSQEWENLQSYGDNRALAMNLLAIAFFIHCLTMIRSFVFSKTINLFLNIFAVSYKEFASYFFIFISILIGISYVWWIAFSPYDDFFGSLVACAFELFQFFGTGEIYVIYSVFLLNQGWTVLIVIISCLLIFIQLDSLMTSIIIENVRFLYLKSKPLESLFFRRSLKKFLLKVSNTAKGIRSFFKKSPKTQKPLKIGQKLQIT